MTGYLRRALSRTLGAGEVSTGLRPFIRSTSPIADLDQRIALADIQGLGVAPDLEPIVGAAEAEGLQDRLHGSTDPIRPQAVRKPSPAASSEGSPLSNAAPIHRSVATASPASVETRAISSAIARFALPDERAPARREASEPRSGGWPSLELPRNRIAGTGIDEASGSSDHVDIGTASAVPASAGDQDLHAADREGSALRPVSSKRHPSEPLQPTPSPALDRALAGAAFAQGEDGFDQRVDPGPRLVIGEINVEVVKPGPARPQATTAPSKRVTAESVSQIGSLSAAVSTRRVLSLRGR